jgi:hypothetical protein
MKAFNFQLEKSTPKPSLHITQLHNSKKRTLYIPNKTKPQKPISQNQLNITLNLITLQRIYYIPRNQSNLY